MKYEKPYVTVVGFEALQRIAIVPEEKGTKSSNSESEDILQESELAPGPRG